MHIGPMNSACWPLVCEKLLKADGNLVIKIFPGEEFESFVKLLKSRFKKVKAVVPEATRKTSSERYLVCLKFKIQTENNAL